MVAVVPPDVAEQCHEHHGCPGDVGHSPKYPLQIEDYEGDVWPVLVRLSQIYR